MPVKVSEFLVDPCFDKDKICHCVLLVFLADPCFDIDKVCHCVLINTELTYSSTF